MTEDELVFKAMEVMKRKVDRLSAENAKQEAIIQLFFNAHDCLRWCNHLPAEGASEDLPRPQFIGFLSSSRADRLVPLVQQFRYGDDFIDLFSCLAIDRVSLAL